QPLLLERFAAEQEGVFDAFTQSCDLRGVHDDGVSREDLGDAEQRPWPIRCSDRQNEMPPCVVGSDDHTGSDRKVAYLPGQPAISRAVGWPVLTQTFG